MKKIRFAPLGLTLALMLMLGACGDNTTTGSEVTASPSPSAAISDNVSDNMGSDTVTDNTDGTVDDIPGENSSASDNMTGTSGSFAEGSSMGEDTDRIGISTDSTGSVAANGSTENSTRSGNGSGSNTSGSTVGEDIADTARGAANAVQDAGRSISNSVSNMAQ